MTDRRAAVLVLAAFAATLPAAAARAQSAGTGGPNYTDLSNYLISQSQTPGSALSGAGGNVSTVTQTGNGNDATVDVQGAYNVTSQTQTGTGNLSTLAIVGASNSVTSTQNGSGDTFSLKLNGDSNTVTQTQIGNNLSYTMTVVGNGGSMSIKQVGGH